MPRACYSHALVGQGLLVFAASEGAADQGASVAGDLVVVASNLFAALGYVAGGRLQRTGYPARGTTFWGVALFAVVLVPLLPLVVEPAALSAAAPVHWAAIAYLAVGVTIIGYILWYWALGTGGIARVGLIQFLQPVSGVLLAWLLLAETPTPVFLLASLVILGGVFIALKEGRRA